MNTSKKYTIPAYIRYDFLSWTPLLYICVDVKQHPGVSHMSMTTKETKHDTASKSSHCKHDGGGNTHRFSRVMCGNEK